MPPGSNRSSDVKIYASQRLHETPKVMSGVPERVPALLARAPAYLAWAWTAWSHPRPLLDDVRRFV